MTLAASLLAGALLGATNALAAVWVARRAIASGAQRGMQVVLGGMMVRMALVLVVVTLVLALAPVHRMAFVAGLGVLFVLGLVAESVVVLGRPSSSRSHA